MVFIGCGLESLLRSIRASRKKDYASIKSNIGLIYINRGKCIGYDKSISLYIATHQLK